MHLTSGECASDIIESDICFGYLKYGPATRNNDEYAIVGDFWTSRAEMPPSGVSKCQGLSFGDNAGHVLGGYNKSSNFEYTKSTNSWATRAAMPANKAGAVGWSINDDTGIIAAGSSGSSHSAATYKYTKSANSWVTRADIISPSRGCAGGFTLQGKGYICGGGTSVTSNGYAADGGGVYDTNEFDDTADSWTSLADTPDPSRAGCGGGGLIGKGYLVGGYYKDCDEYDRAANVWANKADMPAARTMAGVCTGSDDTLYTIGGYTSSPFEFYTTVYVFAMPRAPWTANLSPAHEQTGVSVDADIMFDILDETGVDPNTITVKVGDTYAVIDGVFQPGFTGSITIFF